MTRITLPVFATLLATGAAFAAPEDYLDRLPQNIRDMERVEAGMVDDQLVAYYGETIGRATLRIFPAPEADPNGAGAQDGAASGVTPSAQRALFELLAANLAEGTAALGEGYTTEQTRLHQVAANDEAGNQTATLLCGTVARMVADTNGLLDNICLLQNNGDIIALSITAPHDSGAMRDQLNTAHQLFAVYLIDSLIRE